MEDAVPDMEEAVPDMEDAVPSITSYEKHQTCFVNDNLSPAQLREFLKKYSASLNLL